MGRYGDAITCFQKALTILDQIREDTGIARERVMEKLSEASESLEKSKAAAQQERQDTQDVAARGEPRHRTETSRKSDKNIKTKRVRKTTLDSLLASEDGEGTKMDRQGSVTNSTRDGYRDSVFSKPEVSSQLGSLLSPLTPLPTPPTTQDSPFRDTPDDIRPSITQRRGVKALPPINASNPSKPPPTHKHAITVSKKGKRKLTGKNEERGDGSNYSVELKAYMDSYRDSSGEEGSHDSSHSSYIQAIKNMDGPKEPSPPLGPGGETADPQPQAVREGSLAIGLDARENFTVETVEEWSEGKGGRKKRQLKKEIIKTSLSAGPSPSQHADGSCNNNTASQPRNQSRLCTIL